ncbi:HEPN domain-containing protein [Candidatus Pacearchaeota archaeon]|nr:HEPN domain-containing protein [Candidatus Pacearchaeota archaeon]
MDSKKIKWCFSIKEGLSITNPNERLSKSYLEQAKSSLLKAERDFLEKDFLWATVTLYYAEYYALYSFLQRIGIKCENHSCSILLTSLLLGEENTRIIEEHKDKRIDAQYYMKVGQEDKIEQMLKEGKGFVASFDNLVSQINEKDINFYLEKVRKLQ